MDKKVWVAFIIILFFIFFWALRSEQFTSSAERAPAPILTLTKYISDVPNAYPDREASTKYLRVLEVYRDGVFKLYADDGLVREGQLPPCLQNYVGYLLSIASQIDQGVYCQIGGNNITQYSLDLNGFKVNLGICSRECLPGPLHPIRKFIKLMEFSEMSRSDQVDDKSPLTFSPSPFLDQRAFA